MEEIAQSRRSPGPVPGDENRTAVMATPVQHSASEHVSPRTAGGDGRGEMKQRKRKQLDKRSVDYVLRSGLAGGLAGCAVRQLLPLPFFRLFTLYLDI